MRIFCLIFILAIEIHPQWEQCNGPYGGHINAIAAQKENIFVAPGLWLSGGGLFLSTDGGSNWTRINSDIKNERITDFAVIPDGKCIYALSEESGIYLSTNNGTSWTNISSGLKESVSGWKIPIWNMAVVPNDSGGINLFASNPYYGIFISTDNGTSWSNVSSGLKDSSRSHEDYYISVIKSRVYVCIQPRGIFYSTDAGASWKFLSSGAKDFSGLPVPFHNIILGSDSTSLFASSNQGVYRSTDGGKIWSKTGAGLFDEWIDCITVIGNSIFVGTYNGLFKSTNNGADWSQTGPGGAGIGAIASQSFSNSSRVNIFAGGAKGEGVFLSTDFGESWTEVNNGLKAAWIGGLTVITDDLGHEELIAGQFGRGIIKSRDNGESWTEINSGLPPYSTIPFFTFNDKYLIAAATYNKIFLSSNYGQNWTDIRWNLPECDFMALLAISDSVGGTVIFLGTNKGLFQSGIKNKKWTSSAQDFHYISSLASMGKYVFAAATPVEQYPPYPSGVFRSSDYGKSWTAVNSGLPESPYILALAVSGQNLFARDIDKGIYFSTNYGDSWRHIAPGLLDSLSVFPIAAGGDSLFACAWDGVYLSIDKGANWKEVTEGLPVPHRGVPALSSRYLFLGTYSFGIWRLPLAEIAADAGSLTEVPEKFSLEQNFPNPFNPTTTIKFSLPYPSLVTLKIYDLLGQEIATPINNEEKPAGVHNAVWRADNISSGIYFYELRAGSFIQTRKLILLR